MTEVLDLVQSSGQTEPEVAKGRLAPSLAERLEERSVLMFPDWIQPFLSPSKSAVAKLLRRHPLAALVARLDGGHYAFHRPPQVALASPTQQGQVENFITQEVDAIVVIPVDVLKPLRSPAYEAGASEGGLRALWKSKIADMA